MSVIKLEIIDAEKTNHQKIFSLPSSFSVALTKVPVSTVKLEGAPEKWMVPFLINAMTDFPGLHAFLNQPEDLYSERIIRQHSSK